MAEFVEPISVERRKVEKAVRSFPRITDDVGDARGVGFKGLTKEGLPFSDGF